MAESRQTDSKNTAGMKFNIISRAIQREGPVFFISAACGPKFTAGTLRRRGRNQKEAGHGRVHTAVVLPTHMYSCTFLLPVYSCMPLLISEDAFSVHARRPPRRSLTGCMLATAWFISTVLYDAAAAWLLSEAAFSVHARRPPRLWLAAC
jgi:hypothetical protein